MAASEEAAREGRFNTGKLNGLHPPTYLPTAACPRRHLARQLDWVALNMFHSLAPRAKER